MIEKNIFQSWYTRNLHPLVEEKINSYKKLNPEYSYYLFTDEDMDNFVNTHYSGDIAECYNKINIIVAKVDFWRYLVLYKYGGVYLDIDSSIERPLRELIKDEDEAIVAAEGNPGNYTQWALMYTKKHPILKKTIELVVNNIKNDRYPNDIGRMTGPAAYALAVQLYHTEITGETQIIRNTITRDTDMTIQPHSDKLQYKLLDNQNRAIFIDSWPHFHIMEQVPLEGKMSHFWQYNEQEQEVRNMSYRIYGVDYGTFFKFKHELCDLLYKGKKHWMQEQKEKRILK